MGFYFEGNSPDALRKGLIEWVTGNMQSAESGVKHAATARDRNHADGQLIAYRHMLTDLQALKCVPPGYTAEHHVTGYVMREEGT